MRPREQAVRIDRNRHDRQPVPDDGAAPQEPDPGDDLGSQPAQVRTDSRAEPVGRDQGEEARPDGQEHVRSEAGRLVVQLTLSPDGATEHGCQQQPAEEHDNPLR